MCLVFKNWSYYKFLGDKLLFIKKNIFLSYIIEYNECGKREKGEGKEGGNKDKEI